MHAQPDQQTLLRNAMRTLNLTRDGFCQRIGVTRRALDGWLLPSESSEARTMPEVVGRYVAEILAGMPAQAARAVGKAPMISNEGKPQLLSTDQLDLDIVAELFRIADLLEPVARRRKVTRVLEGAVLGNLFFEASTRTRMSFGTAFRRLGGSAVDTTGFTFSSMSKGESIYDTSRVVSGYVDALVVRHPEQGSVAEFARATNLPVVNAGDGPGEHPSQALLDLYTIQREFSRLGKSIDGMHIAFVGDLKYGRTVHSLSKLLALHKGIKFSFVAPKSLEMPAHLLERLSVNGHVIEQTDDIAKGVKGCDVLYATRIQKERFSGEAIEGYTPDFQINAALADAALKPDSLIMHPLPRDSRADANDLSTDLNRDPRLAIFRQTDNGIPVRMAIFAMLLGVADQIPHDLRDATWRTPWPVGVDDAVFEDFE